MKTYLFIFFCTISSVLFGCAQAPLASEPSPAVSDPPLSAPQSQESAPSNPAPSIPPDLPPASTQPKSSVFFGGLAYIGLQNWSRVGASGDSKMGFGLGGDLLLGVHIDATSKFLIGPHLSFNQWSADYSNKPNSVTDRVYVDMNDTGLNLLFDFGDVFFQFGTGSSQIKSAMVVNGQDIPYGFSGDNYSYKSFGVGFQSNSLFFSLSGTQYDGFAKYADRIEFNLGWKSF